MAQTQTSLGKRITGCWIQPDSDGNSYLMFALGERRFRIYLHTGPLADSPDASLWIKRLITGGTREHSLYVRLTGLWIRKTTRGASYLFLSLQEGNFRLYLNDRRTAENNQPDYTLYQYTTAAGQPIAAEDVPMGLVPAAAEEPIPF